ncbi:MAG: divalent-cation tolerance protein CutA [Candidatus Sedimenticola endophacoides]|uniref:Divalent-cation tolerance protein CutA n=1 Tax=Candidatus Sedimenticola endophacoides TaxID=2548426 RepID=A0A657PMP9_9GAMM|nr:MAG: divalent-cation tolerance protein CutA [Candidatus Sedimenticola endophacoides]OQX32574.1 MAG: divalent-cation tolerance protein CutA [Candidatus Sedimenticola endophacoides]OQX33733.1 MAG: divalent-cation tolerance protein CutA [Candidatus Sedimenticola endophacoides]OQX40712.1 MAG: divalent-cation tolerance protein CutA [Candidatus Sedimenticola endophacoides]OQX47851.1 MAG: divalent-cation tolerance protein CutA [Candidatus Sedimenticola endophacoides]
MSAKTLLIHCSCPDRDQAEQIAERLIAEHLAACVSITAPVTSLYTWKGTVQREQEVLLLIKSGAGRYAALQQRLLALHPYELPEIIAVPVEQGLPGYLAWIEQCTNTEN